MNVGMILLDLMTHALYGLLVVAFAVAPALMIVRAETRRRNSPEYWRQVGVVVKTPRVFDSVSEVVGRYMGAEIYAQVVFKGIRYTYDRIAPPAYKRRLACAELYLEPGIVYVAR